MKKKLLKNYTSRQAGMDDMQEIHCWKKRNLSITAVYLVILWKGRGMNKRFRVLISQTVFTLFLTKAKN